MQNSQIICRDLKRHESLIVFGGQAFVHAGVFIERAPMARRKLLFAALIRVLDQALLAVIEAPAALLVRLQSIL